MLIPTHKLPDPYSLNIWGTREQLTKQMVSECLSVGLTKSLPLLEFEDHENTWIHAQRVAHFVSELWYDLIEVEIHRTDVEEGYTWVVEGNHRVAAALYLGMKEVVALYNEEVANFINYEVV